MKIPCFHKYFSVNFFICLILVSAILFYRYSILNADLAYSSEDRAISNFMVYYLPQIVSANFLLILTEHILSKRGIIKKHCDVIKSKPFRIFYMLLRLFYFYFLCYLSPRCICLSFFLQEWDFLMIKL